MSRSVEYDKDIKRTKSYMGWIRALHNPYCGCVRNKMDAHVIELYLIREKNVEEQTWN